ncbi:hypothetical protein B0O99DRAFT_336407 [Bisporella sp. PMI_857]|nr:hypothetical protein B0O99DRAFT_336407 [Bisporella sp. PMI_857]
MSERMEWFPSKFERPVIRIGVALLFEHLKLNLIDLSGSKIRQILSWPGEADCEKCGNGDILQGNMILYCAECDIGFHQQCYSINLVPEGHWYCDDCTVVREASPNILSIVLD